MIGKILKITGVTLAVIVGGLACAPYLFKGKIMEAVKTTAEDYVDAKVDFADVDLSLLRDFPNASIVITNLAIVGHEPFEGDTLVAIDRVKLVVDLKSLVRQPIGVKRVSIETPRVWGKVLADGRANWDIYKGEDDETAEQDTTTTAFAAKLDKFTLTNGRIEYRDEEQNIGALLEDIDLTLTGDMTEALTNLVLALDIDKVSADMGGVPYLKEAKFTARADVAADLEAMKFTLKENTFTLNALELNLDGWVSLPDEGIGMDLKASTPSTDFKDVLSLIPQIYAKDFEQIKTGGQFDLAAEAQGVMTDSVLPAFKIGLNVENAYFQYPDLPAKVEAIALGATAENKGGTLDETIVTLKNLSFKIGENPFALALTLKTPISDPDIDAYAKGTFDLGGVKTFYPLEDGMDLAGVLRADLALKGRMSYIEKEQYEKFDAKGFLGLKNGVYNSEDLPTVNIEDVLLNFTSKVVNLAACDVKIANSDFHATGDLKNFIPYVFHDGVVSGTLNFAADRIVVNDFVGEDEGETAASADEAMEAVIVPKNIDFTLNAAVKAIEYDKMKFENLKGVVRVKDGKLSIENATMGAFGGTMGLDATYDTSDSTNIKVAADAKIKAVEYAEVYRQSEMTQKFAPIFENMTGTGSIDLKFDAGIDGQMNPKYETVNGLGKIASKDLTISNVKALDALAIALQKEDLKTLKVKNLTVPFEIKEGRVYTEPFDLAVGKTALNLSGSTGLDQTIDYAVKATLPQSLTQGVKVLEDVMLRVQANIGGTLEKPTVKISAKETLESTKQVVQQQVDKAVDKALAEAKVQKEKLLAEAEKAGDKLIAEAEKTGDKLIAEAEAAKQKAVDKASNALGKLAAEKSGDAAIKAAKKQKENLVNEAKKQKEKLVSEADKQGDQLMTKAKSASSTAVAK